MDNLTFHPISEVFPLMSEAERTELRNDIEVHGLRDPITIFEGQILDGRNRWLACQQLGVDPVFEDFAGSGSPIDYVESKNLRRRNLTDSQRALAAAKLSNLRQGERPRADTPNGVCATQTETAERFNVPLRNISKAKRILKQGVPKLVEMVEDGTVSLSSADQIAAKPKTKQMSILRKGRDKVVSIASRLRVESTLRDARTTHDCCLFCNGQITDINETNFVAFLEGSANVLKKRRGGAQYARYLLGVIEDVQESEIVDEYHTLEQKIFAVIQDAPQNETDIMRKTGAGRDELEYTLNILSNYGWIEQLPQGGKTEVARGRRKMLWSLTPKGEKESDKLSEIHSSADYSPVPALRMAC